MTFKKGEKQNWKHKANSGSFKKGNKKSPKAHKFKSGNKCGFEKGKPSWNKGKECIWAKNLPQSYKNHPLKGDSHWNWQGGITPEAESARKNEQYALWRLAVYERDCFTCQDCGKIGYQLHAHHLVSFAKNKKLRYDIDNGVTLCRECHIKRHTKFRRID